MSEMGEIIIRKISVFKSEKALLYIGKSLG